MISSAARVCAASYASAMSGCRAATSDQRPSLGAVDDDLDEPQGVVVVAQPALRLVGRNVVPGDPALVGRAIEIRPPFDVELLVAEGDGVVLGDAAAVGEVVVVGARVVGLDVRAGSGR